MNHESVILLHGLGRTRFSMRSIEKYLTQAGYTVFNVGYPSRKMCIESLSDLYLFPVVQKAKGEGSSKIHVVTHSMGGLLIRQYLQDNRLPVGSNIVMLAPPNKGSNVADVLKDNILFKSILGEAAQQLTTNPSGFACMLNKVEERIGIIAGTKNVMPKFLKLFSSENDGLVSVEQTKLTEMKGFLSFNFAHTFIMNKPIIHYQVAQFIKYGKFA